MRRSLATSLCLVGIGVSTWLSACSDDKSKSSSPPVGGEGNGNEDGGAAAGNGGKNTGAAPSGGGGSGNAIDGGAANEGGDAPETMGGAENAGAAAEEGTAGAPPLPEPPDLIEASGGPWPDSLTAICVNAQTFSTCPQDSEPFFGQDGSYRLNVPKYSATATTLKDSVTGFVWQLEPDTLPQSQAAAVSYCDALDLAGQTDWRLPTRAEAISLFDEGLGSGSAMPLAVAPEFVARRWTASTTASNPGFFYVVEESLGTWTVADGTGPALARCVRGTPLSGALELTEATAIDHATGLTWQRTAVDDAPRTWREAIDVCQALDHDGKTDWRLPNLKELATLVDETALAAPLIPVDLGGSAEQYWSSTPDPANAPERFAYALETGSGSSVSLKAADGAAAARCVRTTE